MKLEKEEVYQMQNLDGFLRGREISVVSVSRGKVEISVALEEDLCRFGGIMNGGAVLTFCDFAGSLSTMSLQDVLNNLTVSLNADFLLPIANGPVTFMAEVENEGKNLAFVTIRVVDSSQKVCAIAHGIWRLFR